MITQDDITRAIHTAKGQTMAVYEAAEAAINARRTFETARAAKLASGEITGKNEDERKAAARNVLANEYADVERTEANERQARLAPSTWPGLSLILSATACD